MTMRLARAPLVSQTVPCLWFEGSAEEAASFYIEAVRACGIGAALGTIKRWNTSSLGGGGTMVTFRLGGQEIVALDGGAWSAPRPAMALSLRCADRVEADRLRTHLSDGETAAPTPGRVRDRYGVSWSIETAGPDRPKDHAAAAPASGARSSSSSP